MKREKISVDFGHIVPVSTVDWHKKSSCTVFFNKCPLNCLWCQNYQLLTNTNMVDINVIKNKIEESMDFVTSVIFSGGEPTLQEKALETLLRFSRKNDLETAIQTNGYYPDVIKRLIEKGLLDRIFLDLKCSPSNVEKYEFITGSENVHKNVFESFKIVNMSRISSEIRSTIFRPFIQDAYEIGKFLENNDYRDEFVLQTGLPYNVPDEILRKERRIEAIEMNKLARNIARETGLNVTYR